MLWRTSARAYCKHRKQHLEGHEIWLELDYGAFTDSANSKFSVWSATTFAKHRDVEHIDLFFDAANQLCTRPGAKKNGETGIFFIGEIESTPVTQKGWCGVILSGDTGNGYRAYEMLEALSHVFEKFAFTVELIPLGPSHAWNSSDSRIAHLNIFLRAKKATSCILGAQMAAKEFSEAANCKLATRRKFMARSHIFFEKLKAKGVVLKKKFSASN